MTVHVEHLSKKYIISHLKTQGSGSLKESIGWQFRKIKNRFLRPESAHAGFLEDFYALNDVSFDVKQGERVGIIGKNGAGKSTLLKILSRITEPTEGLVRIRGRLASLIEIGTGFHPDLTGRENIFLNGAILGMGRKEIERKLEAIVDFSGVEEFLDTPVKRYSSGMYARLGFSIAVHVDPEILIVDEVLSVGDVSFQKKCMKKMEELAALGKTIFFVGHHMQTLSLFCERGLYLKRGQLVFDGAMEACAQAYLEDQSHEPS